MKLFITVLLAAAALRASGSDNDRNAILKLIHSIWDRPGSTLVVEPVTVVGDYAVAGWAQGEMGGRSILTRDKKAGWRVFRCGGDNVKEVATLSGLGMPADVAKQLVAGITEAEKRISPDLRKRFSTFKGLIKMDAHAKP